MFTGAAPCLRWAFFSTCQESLSSYRGIFALTACDLSGSSVVVSAPRRSILRLFALGQGSVEIDEKSDEDVSAMVPRPGGCGANQRVQRYPLRLVRAGKLELECSAQPPVSRLAELSVERMRCPPRHCDPSAGQTALNPDNVGLCQAVEHHGEMNHRSRSCPLLGIPGHRYPAVGVNATGRGDSRSLGASVRTTPLVIRGDDGIEPSRAA